MTAPTPAERQSITVTVTSHHEEDLASFVQLCKTIERLGNIGASRDIRLAVDGDGSADLRFDFGDTDVSAVEPLPAEESDDMVVVGIGE